MYLGDKSILTCQVSPAFASLWRSVRESRTSFPQKDKCCRNVHFPPKQQPCHFLLIRLCSDMTCNQRGGSTRGLHPPAWSEEVSPVKLCARASYVSHERGISMGPFFSWCLRTHQCGGYGLPLGWPSHPSMIQLTDYALATPGQLQISFCNCFLHDFNSTSQQRLTMLWTAVAEGKNTVQFSNGIKDSNCYW